MCTYVSWWQIFSVGHRPENLGSILLVDQVGFNCNTFVCVNINQADMSVERFCITYHYVNKTLANTNREGRFTGQIKKFTALFIHYFCLKRRLSLESDSIKWMACSQRCYFQLIYVHNFKPKPHIITLK